MIIKRSGKGTGRVREGSGKGLGRVGLEGSIGRVLEVSWKVSGRVPKGTGRV